MLCIDSHEAQCSVVREHLTQQGIVADSAGSARAALDLLGVAAAAGEPYTIVLIDNNLPDMEGVALGAAIKADARHSAVLLVMLSSLSEAADSDRYARAGFAAFLSKPVPQHTLTETLKALQAALAIGMTLPFLNSSSVALADGSAAPDPAMAPLAGFHLLAVDDNPVNLQVVTHMLHNLGASVDVAENGRQGVDMFIARPYALVLMDCQMPELDGYQAATAMRQFEQSMMGLEGIDVAQQRVPILALTAHALEGEREKCLAAGMDDFLTKPLRASTLRERLTGWLVPDAVAPGYALDVPGEDALEATRQMFGPKFGELAQLFMNDTPRRMAALESAVKGRDCARMADIAHTLSGSAGALGATTLASLCKQLELAMRSGALDGIDARRSAIACEYARLEARLSGMLLAQHA